MIQTTTMRVMMRMKGWILMSLSKMNCMASVLLLKYSHIPLACVVYVRAHAHTHTHCVAKQYM